MEASKLWALITVGAELILGAAGVNFRVAVIVGIFGGIIVRYEAGRESEDPQGAFPLVAAGSALLYCAGLFVFG